ncbi:MAG: flippase-like domain-containing protein [Candidatus Omnitrophica bacterium]|nr:flippase-like domain-containing protein [Candidatus Omnitrophota bacterium]
MTQKVRDVLSFIGRLGLSGALLFWIFRNIDWQATLLALKSADMKWILVAFLIHLALQFVVLIRWFCFMKALNLEAPIGTVCRYFFIGLFCNLFLPTSIGGDLVKAYGLSRGVGQKPKVYASVVLDRLSGFAGLVVLALVAYGVGSRLIDAPSVMIPISILTAVSLAVGGMLFSRKIYAFFCRVFLPVPRLHKALMDMHADVLLMEGRKRTGVGCVALSVFVQIMTAYMYYFIARALHQDVSILHFLIFTPIACAIAFLPSIGGLGVREYGWVYLLGKVGMEKGIAVSISLISFLFVVIVGIIGGVLYVSNISHRRVQCDQEPGGVQG